ncbi:MAG: hypothetical protein KH322_01295 [Peptoniphilaceae bacterium]|nr:hypothetical protein [Peptoniphilaceae bacterium]
MPIKEKYALTSILIAHDIDDALRMSHVIHAPRKEIYRLHAQDSGRS